MQHHPDVLALVEAELDEVVAGAERAQVTRRAARGRAGVLVDDRSYAGSSSPTPPRHATGHRATRRDRRGAVVGAAVRDRLLDRRAQVVQVVGQMVGVQRGLHGHHAAADVDADRRRDDRAAGGHHPADRRADAVVHVGHHGDPAVDEGQPRDLLELLLRRVLERHAVRPCLDGHAVSVSITL